MRSFRQLFAGRTDVYGIYHPPAPGMVREDGKSKGRGQTKTGQLLDDAWEKHLSGQQMLGIVPIRLDNAVGWFACDIDKYDLDLAELEAKCQKLEIPVVVCRTKSGGAHLYCFVDGTIPAHDAISLMKAWADALDFGRSEIFPKQDNVDWDGAKGNWINIPYFNAEKTDRYAILDGKKLSLSEFEQLANARQIYPDEIKDLKLKWLKERKKERDERYDAPPCIVYFMENGLSEGGRNTALHHWAVYLQKAFPDEWELRLVDANNKYCHPKIEYDELNLIIRSTKRKAYEYSCTKEPMCSVCQKDECTKRKWGVGPQRGINYGEFDITKVVKIRSEPPIYILTINHEEVRFSTEQILSAQKFRARIFESLNVLVQLPKKADHDRAIVGWMDQATIEDPPHETTPRGAVQGFFNDWIETNIPKAAGGIKMVTKGMPAWVEGAVLFKGSDFIRAFRDYQRGRIVSVNEIWDAMREIGCEQIEKNLEGKIIKLWSYKVDDPWFDVPKGDSF